MFKHYVGISPKWMIKSYRLHEVLDNMDSMKKEGLVDLALKLGYYDQAHFIKDFKSIIGKSPLEYFKSVS